MYKEFVFAVVKGLFDCFRLLRMEKCISSLGVKTRTDMAQTQAVWIQTRRGTDKLGEVNILSNFPLAISYGLGVWVL